MKIVCTKAEYIALLGRFETDVAVIEKGDERIYRGENTLYGIPIEVEDGNTVRVVRCKDCKHQRTTDGFYACHKFMGENVSIITNPNNYCSFGRRREV